MTGKRSQGLYVKCKRDESTYWKRVITGGLYSSSEESLKVVYHSFAEKLKTLR